MGRPSKGYGKSKKPKDKPPKKSAEQISDEQQQERLLYYRRRLTPLIAAHKNAGSAVSTAFEMAKKEGITRKDIMLAIQLESEEGETTAKLELERTLRVIRHVGSEIAEQLDLFAKQSVQERAYEDGRRTALDDRPARPPEHLSQQAAQSWLTGHAEGRQALNAQRLGGFKPLGEVVPALGGSKIPPAGDDFPPAPAATETPTQHTGA